MRTRAGGQNPKAATNRTIPESYTRIPKSVVLRQLEEKACKSGKEAGPKQLKAE